MLFRHSIAGLSLASIALASPLQHQARQDASPCAQVSASVAAQASAATPTVPAQLAYECITSVPVNKSAALELLDTIVPYWRWQSTTAWLKDPPAEYVEKVQEAVDVWGGLDDIRSKLEGDEYENEFEFGWALYRLMQTTHDGHFVFVPDVIGTVFNWARTVPLVSISEDGEELPKAYAYPDVLAASLGNSSFTPSAISKIDGKDANDWLENWAQYGSLQDRDALYNNVFYELAVVSLGSSGAGMGTFTGGGRGRWVYPGPTTELEFENGTTTTLNNYAKVLVPFDGVTDGESLYKIWFTSTKPTGVTAEPAATATSTSIPAPGYPPPVIRASNNFIGGYYMEDDYSDIAVLSVPSFSSAALGNLSFPDIAAQFLSLAKAAGKKKLIVDVSANGGGIILQGYDLYKQLFPKLTGYAAADRFRAFEETDLLGQKFSAISETIPRTLDTDNETLFDLIANVVSSPLNYQSDETVDGEPFPDWPAKFGPLHQHDDNYTNLFRWNLSDVLTPLNSGGLYIHGYGPLANYTEQPFETEDIVVVTDGYCASTCTIFSELMRQRANVKYISLGGRSRSGITQAVGGVKGTNNWPWDYIQFNAQYTISNLSTPEEGAEYNSTQLGEYWSTVPFDRLAIGSSINVNFRDGIRDGDETNTPLQFVYEESDCRILYTKEMTVDVTAMWKAVADTTWGGKSHCVAGGLGDYGKRMTKRDLTWSEKELSKRRQQWKRSLSIGDYPMNVFTDLRRASLDGNAIMYP
ncbi:hypothetical protein EJ04DRAFT_423133 [Polyplosphaeria fusca]|uniref:Tail specific protease domain-containing protein n=1 Tax=Polyplosphaeria fusca TaxID=682080 RepID=A0A9P4V632_9PLEO|nr:hypothetical protein EJ04DRAFT_423133 [Polyplosphaeria fusca]